MKHSYTSDIGHCQPWSKATELYKLLILPVIVNLGMKYVCSSDSKIPNL